MGRPSIKLSRKGGELAQRMGRSERGADTTFERGPRFEVAATSVTFEIGESHFWTAVGWIL